jgi:hypothetical protein
MKCDSEKSSVEAVNAELRRSYRALRTATSKATNPSPRQDGTPA